MTAALLVADLDVINVGIDQGVVRREVGPARDAEDVLDALGLERFHQGIGCAHGTSDRSNGRLAFRAGVFSRGTRLLGPGDAAVRTGRAGDGRGGRAVVRDDHHHEAMSWSVVHSFAPRVMPGCWRKASSSAKLGRRRWAAPPQMPAVVKNAASLRTMSCGPDLTSGGHVTAAQGELSPATRGARLDWRRGPA